MWCSLKTLNDRSPTYGHVGEFAFSLALLIVVILVAQGFVGAIIGTLGFVVAFLAPLPFGIAFLLFVSGVVPQAATLDLEFLIFGKIFFSELITAALMLRYALEISMSGVSFKMDRISFTRSCLCTAFIVLFIGNGIAKNGLANMLADVRPLLHYLVVLPAIYMARKNGDRFVMLIIFTVIAASIVLGVEFALIRFFKGDFPYSLMPALYDENRVSLRNGGYFVFSLAIVLALWRNFRPTIKLRIIIFWVLAALLVASLLAQSRTAFVVFAVQLLAFNFMGKLNFRKATKKIANLILLLAVLAVLVAAFPGSILGEVVQRFELALHPEENVDTLISRTSMIAAAWVKFIESPILGMGFGSKFEVVLLEYSFGDNYYIDNLWVVLLCKFGVVGMGYILYSVVTGFNSIRLGWNDMKTAYSREFKALKDVAVLVIIAETLMSLTGAQLWVHVASIVPFSIILGCIIGYKPGNSKNEREMFNDLPNLCRQRHSVKQDTGRKLSTD